MLLICSAVSLSGCAGGLFGTITPKPTNVTSAALVGNEPSGGVLGSCGRKSDKDFAGFVIDDWFVRRYNQFIDWYGAPKQLIEGKEIGFDFRLSHGDGITPVPPDRIRMWSPDPKDKTKVVLAPIPPGSHLIDEEHMGYNRQMLGWSDNNVSHQTMIGGLLQ